MRNNKGITLISLVTVVILMGILATVTISVSINSYNNIKYESAVAELEELQGIVDEITSDYQVYLKESKATKTYVEYFEDRYGVSNFSSKLVSNNLEVVADLIVKYPSLNSVPDKTFYFTKADIKNYFGLKGIDDVVIDFSKRVIYFIDGIEDPDNEEDVYFKSTEFGIKTVVSENSVSNTTRNILANKIGNSGNYYDVELTITPVINNISTIYVCSNNKSVKNENFRDVSIDSNSTKIRLTVEGSGTYTFKIVDEIGNEYVSGEQSIL